MFPCVSLQENPGYKGDNAEPPPVVSLCTSVAVQTVHLFPFSSPRSALSPPRVTETLTSSADGRQSQQQAFPRREDQVQAGGGGSRQRHRLALRTGPDHVAEDRLLCAAVGEQDNSHLELRHRELLGNFVKLRCQ